MPWSSQGGSGGTGGNGGGRKGGGGPWGQGPWGPPGGGGGKEPPDLDEILRRGQDRMRQVMRGGGGNGSGGGSFGGGVPKPFLFFIAMLLFAGVAFYGFFYRVNPDEQGIVLRFGKFERWDPPGLHWRLPYPIEEVRLPKVTQQRTIEVGAGRSVIGGQDSGLMLTGDGSVVDVRFVVFWRISPSPDPATNDTGVQQFLFNIAQPETTVREVAESAMREVVARTDGEEIRTKGRQDAQQKVQQLIQSTLDSYNSGILISGVQLEKADPPPQVVDAFEEVQRAEQNQNKLIREAEQYRNQKLGGARGEASKIVEDAKGYKAKVVNEAQGESQRFVKVYDEYAKAKDVTRRRIYLETLEDVLSRSNKIILQGGTGSGVIPYLPLPALKSEEVKPQPGAGGQQ